MWMIARYWALGTAEQNSKTAEDGDGSRQNNNTTNYRRQKAHVNI